MYTLILTVTVVRVIKIIFVNDTMKMNKSKLKVLVYEKMGQENQEHIGMDNSYKIWNSIFFCEEVYENQSSQNGLL